MTNPFPFTSGNILNASELNAIGEAETWTPTWHQGVTVGNGTVVAYYQQVNDIVAYCAVFTLGSTSAVTANVLVSVPVAGQDVSEVANMSVCTYYDASAVRSYYGRGQKYGTDRFRPYIYQADSTYAFGAGLSSTAPFTWTTSDIMTIGGVYRSGT